MNAKNSSTAPKDGRTRNWTFVLYPESAPSNWRDVLDELHCQWIESPLHECDTNPDGECKKAHIHILMLFEGKKSYEQVKTIIEPLNCTIPQICHDARGLVRYMAHLDNPEKFQYSTSDILGHGGADVLEYLKPNSAARYELVREMIDFIANQNITEFQDLMDYAAHERFDDWFPLLCDNSAFVVGQYIKSQRHRSERTQGSVCPSKAVSDCEVKND